MGVAVRQLGRRLTRRFLLQSVTQVLPRAENCQLSTGSSGSKMEHYRADGVRITHDPYAPGMAEKYGMPGKTDQEGFDPYRDTVGPGIYGGIVKRDENGEVVIGMQYQNHNSRPGPVYAGGGYTPINTALGNEAEVSALLDKFPDLVNDISTGGAQPLHMCGMSKRSRPPKCWENWSQPCSSGPQFKCQRCHQSSSGLWK